MDDATKLLLAAGIGAAGMYYLDPARGRYRRALVRNQAVHAGHKTRRALGVIGRDFWNRGTGAVAELRATFDSSQPDDDVLVERVRACLGRVVTHPASVHVEAADGVVTLSGPILANEVGPLLHCARRVHGVRDVRNELDVHEEPGRVPGLQGEPAPRVGHRLAFLQSNWSPAARTVGAIAGAAAALHGFGRRDMAGTLVGSAGALLFTRAATNLDMRRLFGIGSPRHAVEIHKSIRIQAPVEHVFSLWEDFESFPAFMTHVRRVRPIETTEGKRRSRWTVSGPLGFDVDFDAVVTAREENRLIAWRTEGSAFVRHAGIVHFHANDDGSTTVDVKMVYNPLGGAIGHAVAWLLHADPKQQMDDDLLRLKTFVETGRPPRDAAEPNGRARERVSAQAELWRHDEPPPREAQMPGVR